MEHVLPRNALNTGSRMRENYNTKVPHGFYFWGCFGKHGKFGEQSRKNSTMT